MRTRFAITTATAATILLTLPAGAGAKAADRNRDGIPDSWERKHRLALVDGQDAKDQDKDGLTNLVEWQADTHPRRRDSDRDGRPDGREDADRDGLINGFEGPTGHDAGEPDTDGDDVPDGREGAGRVSSVRGAVVTIDLGRGRTAKGDVTDDTLARCAIADDWLLGILDEPGDEEEPTEEGDGPIDEVEELADDLLPTARTGAEEDAPVEDEVAEDESSSCEDGAVRKGTWIHGSDVEAGVFGWLDVVVPDED